MKSQQQKTVWANIYMIIWKNKEEDARHTFKAISIAFIRSRRYALPAQDNKNKIIRY